MTTTDTSANTPTRTPTDPDLSTAGAPQSQVLDTLMEQLQDFSAPEGSPQAAPPQAVTAATETTVTAWHDNQKVTAMWANAFPRNAWAAVQGLGWRKINPANDSSHASMVALLTMAEQTGASCRLRIEADNLIHEVYVW